MTGRSISESQREQFLKLVGSATKDRVELLASIGDPEAQKYQIELTALLKTGGWIVARTGSRHSGPLPRNGVTLVIQDRTQAPPTARLLRTALTSIGIDAVEEIDPGLQAGSGTIRIVVGGK